MQVCRLCQLRCTFLGFCFNLNKKETLLINERLKMMFYKMFPIVDIFKINELFLKRQGLVFDDMNKVSYDDIAGLLIIKDYIFGLSQKYKTKYVQNCFAKYNWKRIN